MNKTKIEWCDYTWNPITGCTAGCPYCYARKIALRFDGHFRPTFHPERLGDLIDGPKKPKRIFVGSMGDLFDPGVKKAWRVKTFEAMAQIKYHKYYLLTKQPQNIADIDLLNRYGTSVYVGVTVTGPQDLWRVEKLIEMVKGKHFGFGLFISFEPLLADVGNISGIDKLNLVIIGAQTNPTLLPKKEWVENIKRQCGGKGVKYFLKSNLTKEAKS